MKKIYINLTQSTLALLFLLLMVSAGFGQTKKIYINFNLDTPAGFPWNNTNSNPTAGVTIDDLLDDQGQSTGIGITLQDAWTGVMNSGATIPADDGVYPNYVIKSYYRIYQTTAHLKITGLIPARPYTFRFLSSRNSDGSPNTDITIGSETITTSAAYNSTTLGEIVNVTSDANGEVIIAVKNSDGNPQGYLNGMEMEYLEDTPPAPVTEPLVAPSNVTFSNVTEHSFDINWTNGDGSGRIVLMREWQTPTTTGLPKDGAEYSWNSDANLATFLSPNYIVYVGSGSGTTITGLDLNKYYGFAIFEFNGSGADIDYLISSRASGGQYTSGAAPQPSVSASAIEVNSITETSAHITWTSGNGEKRLMIARVNQLPTSSGEPKNGLDYAFNSDFTSAPGIGPNKIVYEGSGDEMTISGLMPNTQYGIKIFEFNGYDSLTNYMDSGTGAVFTTISNGVAPDVYEIAALQDLYESTGGANWTNNTGWPTDWSTITSIDQVVGWHGLAVNNGDVIGINLGDNGLSGSIPASLNNLQGLKVLQLQRNGLHGGIPDLSGLAVLEELHLSNNALGGSIPSWITGMQSLQKLDFENCRLTGEIPGDIGNLTNLTLLSFRVNQLTGPIPASVNNLRELIQLRVDVNLLSGPLPDLRNLAAVQLLDLNRNEFTGEIPKWIGGLTSLKYVRLWNNNFVGHIPATFGKLQQLEQLDLSGCQLTGKIPAELTQLPKLKYLYLQNNDLEGAVPEFPVTSILQELDLKNTKITSLPILKTLQQITKVQIEGTLIRFTDIENNMPDESTPQFLTFHYSPLGQPDTEIETSAGGDVLIVNDRAGGQYTTYQWQEWNGTAWINLMDRTNADLSIPEANQAHIGKRYRCEMNNTLITDITLYSSTYVVKDVNDAVPADFDINPLYNGNITSMKWASAVPEEAEPFESGTNINKGIYLFDYDEKYQLKEAVWGEEIAGTVRHETNKYRVNNLQYDLNGNIKTLRRYDGESNKKHDFKYDYNIGANGQPDNATLQNNQLDKIDGHATYHYNEIGQLVSEIGVDGEEKYVDYDVTGKVTAVYADAEKTQLKVSYKYDDRGFRLMSRNEETGTETWYIRDASGNVTSIYEKKDETEDLVRTEVPVYGSGKLGVYYPQQDGTVNYELTDHLGNVRAVVKKRKTTFTATMEDTGVDDYTNPRVEEMAYFQNNLFEIEYGPASEWFNHTSTNVVPDPKYSALLDGSPTRTIGPAITLKVEPGDKITNMRAYAKFEIQESYNAIGAADLVSALTTTYIGANGLEVATELESIFSSALTGFVTGSGEVPKAYLNYIVFDNDFDVIGQDRVIIHESAGFVTGEEHLTDFYEMKFADPVVITEAGYIYFYASNESSGSKVWYDDLSITLNENVVNQATDYYPFGMVMRRSNTPNAYAEGKQESSLKASVVGQYTFDGTTNDMSGNGNTALAYGGTYEADVDGNANSAYALDGVDDYLLVPDHATLDFGAEDFTVSFWVNKRATSVGWSNVGGVGKWNNGGSPGANEWNVSIGGNSMDQPAFAIESGTDLYVLRSTKALTIGQWNHVLAMRKDGKIYIFIDGNQTGSLEIGGIEINNVDLPMYIGKMKSVTPSNAIFDDIQIFNRGLELAEIRNLADRKSLEEIDEIMQPEGGFGEYYRYGFQGQFAEEDGETGWNSFELRMYDAVIGRWLVPDPHGEFWSPYVAFGNDPINRIDPDGGMTGDPKSVKGIGLEGAMLDVPTYSFTDHMVNSGFMDRISLDPVWITASPLTFSEDLSGTKVMGKRDGWDVGLVSFIFGPRKYKGWDVDDDGYLTGIRTTNAIYDGPSGGGSVKNAQRTVNSLKKILPATKKMKIDIKHILSGHTSEGRRAIQSGKKSIFQGMNARQIERAVKNAYKNVHTKLKTQGDRMLIRGDSNGTTIEMWINKATKTIETAYPII